MPITYPLTLPTVKSASRVVFNPFSVVASSRSPFTRQHQIQVFDGQQWNVSWEFPILERPDADTIKAFMLKMNGQEGTVTFGDPAGQTPRGSASSAPGTPVVNGVDQSGNELIISGAPASTTGYLLPGDYIQLETGIDSRLHMVLDQVDTGIGGVATILIWPNLRTGTGLVQDGAAIVVSNTVGVWSLSTNVMSWGAQPTPLYNIALQFEESLPLT